MRVMTALGPVGPEELGITLPHEHIIVDLRHSLGGFSAVLDDVSLAVDELRAFKEAGGGTVVEVTNECLGRNAQALKHISQESGVHIVASTGFGKRPYFPTIVQELNTNALADLLVKEIEEGIGNTGIRAGIIGEIGTDRDYITPDEERVFRAAARAQVRTGAAITTHTFLEQLIPDQLEILEDEGVDFARVVIGHLGDKRDVDTTLATAARGVFVQIDHIGGTVHQRDEQRAKTVARLITGGYLSQILLSMDICMKSRLHWYGGGGYDYLLQEFVPLLLEEGVDRSAINTMLIDNPRRLLAFEV